MTNYLKAASLNVSSQLYDLVSNYLCPAADIDADDFWQGVDNILARFMPINQQLLQKRQQFEQQINDWYKQHPTYDAAKAMQFLQQIGYIVPEGEDFVIETDGVDDDIAKIPGPQLVVPVNNARYAVNAANARWGSLFDALYGSNVISTEGDLRPGKHFNMQRAKAVVDYVLHFLNDCFALQQGRFHDVTAFSIAQGQLIIHLDNGSSTQLLDTQAFVGFQGDVHKPRCILLKHQQLHVQLHIDAHSPIAASNRLNLCDVVIEAAITTIQDCEDSVAAVDGKDKTQVYQHWFELMQGTLCAEFNKGGKRVSRSLAKDPSFTSPSGEAFTLRGRCTLFVRNVGHLMTTPAVLNAHNEEVPEGILDACITALASINDIKRQGMHYGNSSTASMYIVKPKMHGPEEVSFTNNLFAAVEDLLQLPRYTLKMGIMDEERRTSLNLKECIRAAKHRVVFINTGFLDRTGDEIHTSMHAGVFVRKNDMKQATWLHTYEKQNVQIGLACGFQGKAQIGKGMWAIPDDLHSMMQSKLAHPQSGANTAWVPSPTAATLHALHYHQTDVWQNQQQAIQAPTTAKIDLLQLAITDSSTYTAAEIQAELNNNCQGLLGYTVRWIDAGIGCSKVADINNVGLMEDRATVRISSQLIANWLQHQVVSREQVQQTLRKMAQVVDQQNADDPNYEPMTPDCNGIAFKAAEDLIFKGSNITNGYTEPSLHQRRLQKKAH